MKFKNESKARRLARLSRIAGDLEYFAYLAGERDRAFHFMYKMYALTKLAQDAAWEGK